MLGTILSWLGGGAISAIGSQLNQAYQAKLAAQNDHERIEAEQRIATLEAQQAVLVAEQGRWLTAWIRPAFALPFILFNFKVIVWDKMLGWGVTDDLSDRFWQLQMVVFGAYFLSRGIERMRK